MRVKHIDALRGIAAILVTFFHLTGNGGLSPNIASYGSYGWLGVEMFFVISGFVLPYSMYKSNYKPIQFGRFMLKRILRVYPAYIVTGIIGIAMACITHRPGFSAIAIFLHLFFLNGILGQNWISPVFWTLAIEFQFYLLIGLLYRSFSAAYKKTILLISFLTVFSFVFDHFAAGTGAYIFHWFPIFALGILIFSKKTSDMPLIAYWSSTIILLAYIGFEIGFPECAASALAVLFIMADQINTHSLIIRILLWFGKISYSLYLMHWELGRAAISVSRRIPLLGQNEMFRLAIGFIFSVFAAFVLYVFIEKPSMAYAGKVKYKQ